MQLCKYVRENKCGKADIHGINDILNYDIGKCVATWKNSVMFSNGTQETVFTIEDAAHDYWEIGCYRYQRELKKLVFKFSRYVHK